MSNDLNKVTSIVMPASSTLSLRTGIYRHFKGNLYEVLGAAKHSETQEDMVVYRALYGEYGVWVRPLVMFFETVLHDGANVARFQFLHDAAKNSSGS